MMSDSQSEFYRNLIQARYVLWEQHKKKLGFIRDRVPHLTDEEKLLLRQYEGCFKCRRFFVDCQASTCTKGFPDPLQYHSLTMADVDIARARRDKELIQAARSYAPVSQSGIGEAGSAVGSAMRHTQVVGDHDERLRRTARRVKLVKSQAAYTTTPGFESA
ncbi:uncharacterized protein C8Q71DRAFT_544700 [Rhodofomes roseus]|uniref:Uncharacterized protein n=1 Tax=Rhodofomes roseus TaxID=34475 RepID=A0ABQ8KLF4_9APHY|nr:uncharacterized protein C8Q71DRAFT_544700 [Rhodofomes roseus]KAH9838740.1 hypothetical protein C8Q71DRAFT_544700 [Rhodofomes roseus]